MPGEIIQTSLQLPLNIVSVLCKSGNQSTLYRVVYAKGANPNQFITYPETSNLFIAHMEIQICRSIKRQQETFEIYYYTVDPIYRGAWGPSSATAIYPDRDISWGGSLLRRR